MINKVTLLGRVGKDPEVRNLDNGSAVASFSLATTKSWKDKQSGEKKEQTAWHNLVMWRGLADVAAKYVHKGDLLYVEGEIVYRSYEKDGTTKYITEILVNELKMLSGKKDQPASAGHTASTAEDGPTDDLPF